MAETPYERILTALETSGRTVKPAGNDRAKAQCPAHDDNDPSLSVSVGRPDDRGRASALVYCHGGCKTRDIMTALGLTLADLLEQGEAAYRYDDGRTVVRSYPNGDRRFVQYRAPKGTATALYRLAQLQQATQGAVYLVEGEKDVLAVEAAGGVATTAPQGAANFHLVDPEPLRGRDVVAVVDQDPAGAKWAAAVRSKLHGVAASLRFAAPRVGKDAADHIAAGYGLQDWRPHPTGTDPADVGPAEAAVDEPTTWEPVDLGPYLRGEITRPQPTLGLSRSDGLQLLYPGKEHAVIGEMEAGKSWLALAHAGAEIGNRRHVVYLHFEESDPADTVERLQALGTPDADILRWFRFVGPERRAQPDWLAPLLDPPPSLVILDGVNEAMALHGDGIREEDGAAEFRRRLVKPFTKAGAAVLALDHVIKDREARGRYALGSVHKGNALSGSLVLLETAEPFGRGMRGRSHVTVMKDRPGHLRRNGTPDRKVPGKTYMGELVVDDTRTWVSYLDLVFVAPADPTAADPAGPAGADPDTEIDDAVFRVVADICSKGKQATTRAVRASAKLRAGAVSESLERLHLADRLQLTRRGNANIYSVPETNSLDGSGPAAESVPGSGPKGPGTAEPGTDTLSPVPGTNGNQAGTKEPSERETS